MNKPGKRILIFLIVCVAIFTVYSLFFKTTTFKEVVPEIYKEEVTKISVSMKTIDEEESEREK